LKHFCIDIDNVIAQTDRVMRKVIAEHTNGRVQLEYSDIVDYDYYKCADRNDNKITPAEWRAIHLLFSEKRNLWQVEPTSGAVQGLQRLAEKAVLHFATARLPKARAVTIEWLADYEFPKHDLHFLQHGEKHSSLRPFRAAVEDHYDQAKSFATLGDTPCFLLRHPWNHGQPAVHNVFPVEDWVQLTDRLLELA